MSLIKRKINIDLFNKQILKNNNKPKGDNKVDMNDETLCMVTLLFDSGQIESGFYGEYIFEKIIRGGEISKNSHKVVVSHGDIFSEQIYEDILPFTIQDDLCSIEKEYDEFKGIIYGVLFEDISFKIAKEIDKRLKDEVSAYIGMTSIDYNSRDPRKQFWKSLIRAYSIEEKTIVCFGYKDEGFMFESKAKEYGFYVNFDNFFDDLYLESKKELFSTRQSSYIKQISQMKVVSGKSDSDRGILEMNYALVKEVEISGVQIWKSIEDINRVYLIKNSTDFVVDYLFTSLYQASQGIERLLKISIELLVYGQKYDKEKVEKLLYSHSHVAMADYLTNKGRLNLKSKERHLIEILSRFYNCARYNRYSYSENNLLEVELIQEFTKSIKSENYAYEAKHRYGKSIGKISRTLYNLIHQLAFENKIFTYELHSDSVAAFVFLEGYSEDLYSILEKIELSKKELLWFLIKKGGELPLKEFGEEYRELPFEDVELQSYLYELIANENSGEMIYEFVSHEYDEMIAEDKEKWKKRLKFIKLIF